MQHKWHKCNAERCNICDGGLGLCTVCNGAEASLTTECCGRALTKEEEDAIMGKRIDFKDGKWIFINGWHGIQNEPNR